jgi:hypothetical protein
MITYVTYRTATFPSRAAFGIARAEAEAAGWFFCTVEGHGKGATALFGFEEQVDTAANYIRPELPDFRSHAHASSHRDWFAGVTRLAGRLHRRRARAPMVPRIRSSMPHSR